MKTLLIILTITSFQAFALGVYNFDLMNPNCIFQKNFDKGGSFFTISTPNGQGISKPPMISWLNTYDPFCIYKCNAFNEYKTVYIKKYGKNNPPQLLTEPSKIKLGFVPIYYQIQFHLKDDGDSNTYCSGNLFKLSNTDKLVVLTAKHCIKPLDVNAYEYLSSSLAALKEGLSGERFTNIGIEHFENFKQNPNADAATMTIKNKELSLIAEKSNSIFENFKTNISHNNLTIYNAIFNPSSNPIHVFFFGGGTFYSFNNQKFNHDEKHSVSAAYLYVTHSQSILPNLEMSESIHKSSAGFVAKFEKKELKLISVGINPVQQLLFCRGDSGGAIIEFDPVKNQYLFLGILLGNITDSDCGFNEYMLPITNIFPHYIEENAQKIGNNINCNFNSCNIF